MNFRRAVRESLQRLAGVHCYRVLPRGIDVAYDISRALPAYRMQTIFDVGANVGQSAKRYAHRFPAAQIYCFEPVRDSFRQLQENVKGNDRIHCARVALGASSGTGQMSVAAESVTSFLIPPGSGAVGRPVVEDVEVATLDEFCLAGGIHRVSYLKIDTEGGDLDVLKGGTRLLEAQSVDFVEVEASMHAGNRTHVPFDLLRGHLESKNYLLFGIYSQVAESSAAGRHLRRTNSTFISARLIGTHTPDH